MHGPGIALLICALLLPAGWLPASAGQSYRVVFYPSGSLRIQAYLYVPPGNGPFPTVIYNHGSRLGRERTPVPQLYIGEWLNRAGYAAFVPERRGYGESDGPTFNEEVPNYGPPFIARMQRETDDVLAAAAYLKKEPSVDSNRLATMGWSLGGIVTVFASSRTTVFRAAVDEAGGALTWHLSPALQTALKRAVEVVNPPVLLMAARNDATVESVTELAKIFEARKHPYELKIYPPFTPPPGVRVADTTPPGHMIFGPAGLPVWSSDVLGFLVRYMK